MHKLKLGQYKDLRVTPPVKYTTNDLELAVIDSIIKFVNQWAKNNKPAELGDEITVTIQAECEGMFVPELSKSNFKYRIGAPTMLDQFTLALSKKVGDCFQVEIDFPENAPIQRIKGKKVTCLITIQELSPAHQIELTDEIAKEIDPQVSGIDDLKNKLRKLISSNWQHMIDQNTIQSILDMIIVNSKYELDEEEFIRVYKAIVSDARKKMFSVTDEKVLESLFSSKNDEYFYKDCRNLAERSILEDLIINEIIKLEKIKISDAEFEKGKSTFIQMLKDEATFQNKFPSDDALRNYLLHEKTLEFLLKWNIG